MNIYKYLIKLHKKEAITDDLDFDHVKVTLSDSNRFWVSLVLPNVFLLKTIISFFIKNYYKLICYRNFKVKPRIKTKGRR